MRLSVSGVSFIFHLSVVSFGFCILAIAWCANTPLGFNKCCVFCAKRKKSAGDLSKMFDM